MNSEIRAAELADYTYFNMNSIPYEVSNINSTRLRVQKTTNTSELYENNSKNKAIPSLLILFTACSDKFFSPFS